MYEPDLGKCNFDIFALEGISRAGKVEERAGVGLELLDFEGVRLVVEGVDEHAGQGLLEAVLLVKESERIMSENR